MAKTLMEHRDELGRLFNLGRAMPRERLAQVAEVAMSTVDRIESGQVPRPITRTRLTRALGKLYAEKGVEGEVAVEWPAEAEAEVV